MMRSRGSKRAGRVLTAALVLAAARAAADPATAEAPPPTHLASSSAVHTDGGSDLRLPPGYFLAEPTWLRLDAETRRLQDAETRLRAENTSLRASAATGWQPGWYTVVLAVSGGIALGVYLDHKL